MCRNLSLRLGSRSFGLAFIASAGWISCFIVLLSRLAMAFGGEGCLTARLELFVVLDLDLVVETWRKTGHGIRDELMISRIE